jgi:hypothetical protein
MVYLGWGEAPARGWHYSKIEGGWEGVRESGTCLFWERRELLGWRKKAKGALRSASALSMRKCPYCGRWFRNRQAVRAHLKYCFMR